MPDEILTADFKSIFKYPIIRGLPTEFLMLKDEFYDRLRGPAKNMTVLATAFAEGGSERHEPVL